MKFKLFLGSVLFTFGFVVSAAPEGTPPPPPVSPPQPHGLTTLTWHGHAAFEIVTPQGLVLMIDPWLSNPQNPLAQSQKDPTVAVAKLDYILITHGHFDHVGNAVALAKRTGAKLITNFELGANLSKLHGYPKNQATFETLMNIGGEIIIGNGEVKVVMTPAVHSSGLARSADPNAESEIVSGGNAAGFVVAIKNGPTIYHTGDTDYFRDMELIGQFHKPDVSLINGGGHFGMEPEAAARAARAVEADICIPHHFGTFPILQSGDAIFRALRRSGGCQVQMLQPGQSLPFKGKHLYQPLRRPRYYQ